jgi:hypothetical protein
MQYRQLSQLYASEFCKQQEDLPGEDRLSVLQEFPHLKTRHDEALAECNYDTKNSIKSVSKFFELSLVMLKFI